MLRRTYFTPLSTLPLVWARQGRHSLISKPTRRAKSSIRGFHSTWPSSSLPRVTTLALSYRQRRGTPPRYSKAFTWHWMKAAVSALRTSST